MSYAIFRRRQHIYLMLTLLRITPPQHLELPPMLRMPLYAYRRHAFEPPPAITPLLRHAEMTRHIFMVLFDHLFFFLLFHLMFAFSGCFSLLYAVADICFLMPLIFTVAMMSYSDAMTCLCADAAAMPRCHALYALRRFDGYMLIA